MLTTRSGYLFSTCRLDVVNVACAAITWSCSWGISVRRMDAEHGHREHGSKYHQLVASTFT